MTTDAARAPRIDLNADVGEGCDDAALVPLVSSVNVSCGAHAGDDETIRGTVRIARAHDVAVGAHPSFPDRDGFGRRVTTHDAGAIAERAVRLATASEIVAIDGTVIQSEARSLCIHGDNAEAVAIARRVRDALEAQGIEIAAPY